jgi:hypothetical protein
MASNLKNSPREYIFFFFKKKKIHLYLQNRIFYISLIYEEDLFYFNAFNNVYGGTLFKN